MLNKNIVSKEQETFELKESSPGREGGTSIEQDNWSY